VVEIDAEEDKIIPFDFTTNKEINLDLISDTEKFPPCNDNQLGFKATFNMVTMKTELYTAAVVYLVVV
jgi:hypothetical protein